LFRGLVSFSAEERSPFGPGPPDLRTPCRFSALEFALLEMSPPTAAVETFPRAPSIVESAADFAGARRGAGEFIPSFSEFVDASAGLWPRPAPALNGGLKIVRPRPDDNPAGAKASPTGTAKTPGLNRITFPLAVLGLQPLPWLSALRSPNEGDVFFVTKGPGVVEVFFGLLPGLGNTALE